MRHENIKNEVILQLKKEFPNWKRIPKKMKKEIAGKSLEEVVGSYDFKQDIETPVSGLLGIYNQIQIKGIIKLNEMDQYVENMAQ